MRSIIEAETAPSGAVFILVRPAWTHAYGCKYLYELIIVSEGEHSCMGVSQVWEGNVMA
mgnify:CR=1 FL=1